MKSSKSDSQEAFSSFQDYKQLQLKVEKEGEQILIMEGEEIKDIYLCAM